MEFAKIISCGDRKIEITANTQALIKIVAEKEKKTADDIEKLREFDVNEFIKTYGHIPAVLKIFREMEWPIPFQEVFWATFCDALNKSMTAGFLGSEGSKCLSKACESIVPREMEYTYKVEREPTSEDDLFDIVDGKVSEWKTGCLSYNCCKEIKLDNRNQIVIRIRYGWYGGRDKEIALKYPYDYSKLLENVESYLDGKRDHQKKKGNQMILDFLAKHTKEVRQFKENAGWFKKLRDIYCDMLIEDSLIVDGEGFSEKYCGFDIYQKKEEIDAMVQKLQNSNDPGEDKVEYAIKWLCAEYPSLFRAIAKNCESKYRYGSILLKKDDFIDEPQEYDHILITNAGVFIIETKHWKGRVEIRSDGKWVRDRNNDGSLEGIESPVYQIQRHEALMKSILPYVPVHSLLVFSNSMLILEGAKYCRACHVLYVDGLKETVKNILSRSKPVDKAIDYCVNEIEKYKINLMGDDVKVLGQ